MKKILSLVLVLVVLLTFGAFALGSSSSDEGTVSQQEGSAAADQNNDTQENSNTLGDYAVEIKSCRLAKDYDKKPVAIVTYSFTNVNDDTATSFMGAIEDNVYQSGVGLNEAILIDDSYNYKSENSTKEIKKGATLEVEVAYVLNDETTPIDVEVKEFFSFNDKTITKQFTIK